MRAWVVRAGTDGEREQRALEENSVIAGWPEIGDLSDASTRHDIEDEVIRTYPDENNYLIGNWTGQLSRFVLEMAPGDIVLLPRKSIGGFAMGRVTSDYEYWSDADPGFRQRRKVQWKREQVPSETFFPDLRATLGALPTVFEVSRNDAVNRLASIERGEPDPGDSSIKNSGPITFEELKNEAPVKVPIRTLLELVGQMRRSAGTVELIENSLKNHELNVTESLTEGSIDDAVYIEKLDSSQETTAIVGSSPHTASSSSTGAESSTSGSGRYRFPVSQLPSAERPPESIDWHDPISAAHTKMLKDRLPFLLVLSEGGPAGLLTWESLANAALSRRSITVVGDAAISAPISVPKSRPLSEVVDLVQQHGMVLVTDNEQVSGIVTSEDLSARFSADRLPLMYIEEIEMQLREAVRSNLTTERIRSFGVKISDDTEMTLGGYPFLIREDELWNALPFSFLDRDLILEEVTFARDIRNNLSHFSADPLPDNTLNRLESLLRMLRAA